VSSKLLKKPSNQGNVLAGVPVVMMSGDHDISERARELGAIAVVRKPIVPETFSRIIDHFAVK